jgi:hypothetical protein
MMKKLAYTIISIAVIATASALGGWASAGVQDQADPATIPLAPLDDPVADPAKSVVIRTTFDSRSSVSFQSASISIQRAHTRVGDPPILRLTLKDPTGAIIRQMNAWSPLWQFYNDGHDHRVLLPSASGTFVVPFASDLASVTIHDIGLNLDVLTADVTAPIRDFCSTNPSDPDCREADLGVTTVAPVGPLFAVTGRAATLTVGSTVSNSGPDGPVDAVVTRTVAGNAGVTVAPSVPETVNVQSLAMGDGRQLSKTYTVTCTQPGTHTLTMTTSIAPKLASVVDANGANDSKTVTHVVDCAVPVTVNIMPGSTMNPVNLASATVPVALLTTAAGEYGNPLPFDATTIDPLSVRFGSATTLFSGGGVSESHAKGHPEDALELDEQTHDGDTDMLLHFALRNSAVLGVGDTAGCVLGRSTTPSGFTSFFGCDSVSVRG